MCVSSYSHEALRGGCIFLQVRGGCVSSYSYEAMRDGCVSSYSHEVVRDGCVYISPGER